nr:hypothetical protein [Coxiella-like endosymbiont of Rhipicephalus sanguineus]
MPSDWEASPKREQRLPCKQ